MTNYDYFDKEGTQRTYYYILNFQRKKLIVGQNCCANGVFLNVYGIISKEEESKRKIFLPTKKGGGVIIFNVRDLTTEEEEAIPLTLKRNKLEGKLMLAN